MYYQGVKIGAISSLDVMFLQKAHIVWSELADLVRRQNDAQERAADRAADRAEQGHDGP